MWTKSVPLNLWFSSFFHESDLIFLCLLDIFMYIPFWAQTQFWLFPLQNYFFLLNSNVYKLNIFSVKTWNLIISSSLSTSLHSISFSVLCIPTLPLKSRSLMPFAGFYYFTLGLCKYFIFFFWYNFDTAAKLLSAMFSSDHIILLLFFVCVCLFQSQFLSIAY